MTEQPVDGVESGRTSSELGDVARDAVHQLQELLRAEISLVRIQATEQLRSAARGAIAGASAVLLIHTAVLLLALSLYLTLGGGARAAGLSALSFMILSAVLVTAARRMFSSGPAVSNLRAFDAKYEGPRR